MTDHIYLDYAATTPLAPEVLEAMLPWLTHSYGNPSSVHALGRAARNAIDDARDQIAVVLGCAHREIIFTSSGTEADNLAIRGTLDRWSERGKHIVVSAVEHDAVLTTARSLAEQGRAEVTIVGCDSEGTVDPLAVAAAVRDDTVLVSVMLANNEVGTIQDVTAIAARVKSRNPHTLVHSDAVQALGKIHINVEEIGVDMLTVSAHKVYGPKGAGALYARWGTFLTTQVTGGAQERSRRSSTENVAGIVGFGVAATAAESERETEMVRQQELATLLTQKVCNTVSDTIATAIAKRRLPTFSSFAFPGARTDLLLTLLDGMGVYASGGSACSSGANHPSHVLLAMGLEENLALSALRCTVGKNTTMDEIERAAAAIGDAVEHVRSHGQRLPNVAFQAQS